MKKILVSGLLAGILLFVLSVLSLYILLWLFPNMASQYYSPAFTQRANRYTLYYVHPFVIALSLSWVWDRFKSLLKGSNLTRGLEFGLIYTAVATFPMMWLIYSAINTSLVMVLSWLVFGLLQGCIAGLVFERTNP